LATSSGQRFWKRLAVGIGAASLLVVTGLFTSYARHARADAARAHNAIVETFARSNDFLTTGPDYSFVRLLGDTQREAWFIGTTFYISVDQFHDMLLERLQKGIDLHFLILNPDVENVRRVAGLLGVTEEELLPQCLAGIRTLRRLDEEARASKAAGVLRVRLSREPLQLRMYLFDPRSERGFTYYIPQINGVNSQVLPGFLAANKGAPYPAAYFEGVARIWNGRTVHDLSEWLAANPKALPNLTNRPQ
jgi:hypothetical protein